MNEDPHVQLMLRFQEGDEGAFRTLFEENKLPLLNFIYRYCGDRRVSEELAQEVFLRVYRNVATYRPDARFTTWLYRIATNVCLNEIRTGKYRYERDLKTIHNDSEQLFDAPDERSETRADERMLEHEREQTIRVALDALPDKQRMALLMSVYDELSYKEIGERMGSTEGAVKSIIHRAKTALKGQLRKRQRT